MDMAEIGANIRSCRTEKDMTMEELGKAIGKSQSAVADYEKGRVDIPGIFPHQNCRNPGNPPGKAVRYADSR